MLTQNNNNHHDYPHDPKLALEVEECLKKLPEYHLSKSAELKFRIWLGVKQCFLLVIRPQRIFSSDNLLFPLIHLNIKRWAAVSMASLLLITGSGFIYAQQPYVTYGHPLYSIKRMSEVIAGKLVWNPIGQVNHHLDKAARRQEELEILIEERDRSWIPEAYAIENVQTEVPLIIRSAIAIAIARTATDMVVSTEAAMEASTQVKGDLEIQKSLKHIEMVQEDQIRSLVRLAENTKAKTSSKVETALKVARVNVENNLSAVAEARAEAEVETFRKNLQEKRAIEIGREKEKRESVENVKIAKQEPQQLSVKFNRTAAPKADSKQREEKAKIKNPDAALAKLAQLKVTAATEITIAKRSLEQLKERLNRAGAPTEFNIQLMAGVAAKFSDAQAAFNVGSYGKAAGLARATEAMSKTLPQWLKEQEARPIETTKLLKDEVLDAPDRNEEKKKEEVEVIQEQERQIIKKQEDLRQQEELKTERRVKAQKEKLEAELKAINMNQSIAAPQTVIIEVDVEERHETLLEDEEIVTAINPNEAQNPLPSAMTTNEMEMAAKREREMREENNHQ